MKSKGQTHSSRPLSLRKEVPMKHRASQLLLQDASAARNAGRERDGGTYPSKANSPAHLCSHAPSLSRTQTDPPTVHFHSAPNLRPQRMMQQGLLYLPLGPAPQSSRHQPLAPPLPCAATPAGGPLKASPRPHALCSGAAAFLRRSSPEPEPWLPPATHISKGKKPL